MTVTLSIFFILLAGTLVTSALSGMTGMAGGVIFLSLVASVMDAGLAVPLHAAVQLVSNASRLIFFMRYIRWSVVGFFVLGMLPGAVIGIGIFSLLDEHVIKLSMGLFILLMVFAPLEKSEREGRYSVFVPVGFIAGLLGIFFGSTGPLTARFFLRGDISKEELVGTKASCQALTHLVKIPLFGFIGVNVFQFGVVLVYLALAVVVGTFIGMKSLHRISETVFRKIFKALLTMLALRIIVLELMALIK